MKADGTKPITSDKDRGVSRSIFLARAHTHTHTQSHMSYSHGCISRTFSARLVSLQSSSALTSRLSLAALPSAWMKRLSS